MATIAGNATANNFVDQGNYTFRGTGIISIDNSTDYGTNWNFSYTYTETEQDAFYNSTADGLEGLSTISGFNPIIAVVIAAAIILGVIFLIRS